MNSPLVPKSSRVKLEEKFRNDEIIKAYRNIGIDVERFFNSEYLSLFKCQVTGYRFYFPFETVGDAEFYSVLSRNRTNYYSQRWEHIEALKFIDEKDKVLEIGTGFGIFQTLLRDRNINAKGLELNPDAVKKCIEQKLDVEKKNIEEESSLNAGHYEAVVSFQVLEHITHVHSFLKAAINGLKTNGKLVIGVPNNNPYLFINDKFHTLNLPPHHAGLWNEKSLKSLEKLFPVKLVSMSFEPLEITYDYFINFQIQNCKSKIGRKLMKFLNKKFPNILRKLCCKFLRGRNILAVYTKV